MSHPEENGYDDVDQIQSPTGGVTELVLNEYQRISALQDAFRYSIEKNREGSPEKAHETWSPEKAKELLKLLEKRRNKLEIDLKGHPLKMDGSGREARSPLGTHIAYDLELVIREREMHSLALQHGLENPETKKAQHAVSAHVDRWMSRRGC